MPDCDCELSKEWARLGRDELQWVYGVWSCIAIYEFCVIDFTLDRGRDELRARTEEAIADHVCIVFVPDGPSSGVSSRDNERIREIEAAIAESLSRRYRIPNDLWQKASDLLGGPVADSADIRIRDHDFKVLRIHEVVPYEPVLVGGSIWENRLKVPPPLPPATAEEIVRQNARLAQLKAALERGDGEMRIERLTVRDVTEGGFGIRWDIGRDRAPSRSYSEYPETKPTRGEAVCQLFGILRSIPKNYRATVGGHIQRVSALACSRLEDLPPWLRRFFGLVHQKAVPRDQDSLPSRSLCPKNNDLFRKWPQHRKVRLSFFLAVA
jgi:hypothetical protein